MPRYINADKLAINFEKALEKVHLINGIHGVDLVAVIAAIKNAPTADVAEVRHGSWKGGRFNDLYDGRYEEYCSCCGEYSVAYAKPFCPNCGAKMKRSEQ